MFIFAQSKPIIYEQKYQYNGIELTNDFGLMINEARYRTLDPQLGRWWQIDPEVETFEAWSAYNSNLDNPIRYEDKGRDTQGGGDHVGFDEDEQPALIPEVGGFSCGVSGNSLDISLGQFVLGFLNSIKLNKSIGKANFRHNKNFTAWKK